jgi:hypothetical protein
MVVPCKVCQVDYDLEDLTLRMCPICHLKTMNPNAPMSWRLHAVEKTVAALAKLDPEGAVPPEILKAIEGLKASEASESEPRKLKDVVWDDIWKEMVLDDDDVSIVDADKEAECDPQAAAYFAMVQHRFDHGCGSGKECWECGDKDCLHECSGKMAKAQIEAMELRGKE